MELLYYPAWLLLLIGGNAALLHFLHMFQLNSYKPKVQLAWYKKNRKTLRVFLLPLAGGWFFFPKKNAKKPLVFTARVKRLLAALGLLELLWILALLFFLENQPLRLALLYLLQLGFPFLLLLCNALNAPMESAIRRHYINDAKRILQAHPKLLVIGITGSYGKTSVKYFLNTLLRAKYNVLMTPENYNTPMGVVKTIRSSLTAAHEIFICEMGAKQTGDIKELCDIVHPQHGILTSIGPQHLESFRSLENITRTKFELADALPAQGLLFANGENSQIRAMLGAYPNAITYASEEGLGSYYAREISVSQRGTSFLLHAPDGSRAEFTTRLIGRHNVVNLVGAIAAAHTLGVPLQALGSQLRKLQPVPHRLELLPRGNGLLVIDDAYNSNPSGAKAALDTLRLFEGTKILVTPGMIELGSRQAEFNAVFGAQAAAVCDYIALVGSTQTKPVREGALAAGFAPERLFIAKTLPEAMQWVHALPGGGQRILLLENDLPDNY
ncbi:MAG: UDP-N-acetylmuramoyl-tripeptide--D-alanyl-D-alanine ligase [Oscillospiraceae bacterium]|nr:UDP-N-acetylmuramoyl-tripeptide--D-alanyl-D-alanine ligase [Oscillospiraceae bacterium]